MEVILKRVYITHNVFSARHGPRALLFKSPSTFPQSHSHLFSLFSQGRYYQDKQSMIISKMGSTLDFRIISFIPRLGVPPRY